MSTNDERLRGWLDARDPGDAPASLRDAAIRVPYETRMPAFPALDAEIGRLFGPARWVRPALALLVILALLAAAVGAARLQPWRPFPPRGLIAFTGLLGPSGTSGIRVVAADGSGERTVTPLQPNTLRPLASLVCRRPDAPLRPDVEPRSTGRLRWRRIDRPVRRRDRRPNASSRPASARPASSSGRRPAERSRTSTRRRAAVRRPSWASSTWRPARSLRRSRRGDRADDPSRPGRLAAALVGRVRVGHPRHSGHPGRRRRHHDHPRRALARRRPVRQLRVSIGVRECPPLGGCSDRPGRSGARWVGVVGARRPHARLRPAGRTCRPRRAEPCPRTTSRSPRLTPGNQGPSPMCSGPTTRPLTPCRPCSGRRMAARSTGATAEGPTSWTS